MNTKSKCTYILIWNKKIKAINLLGGKCQDCGENKPWLLSFHHKNSYEKEFNISSFRTYRWSLLEKEILKCDLLCHNCHYKRHFLEIKKDNRNTISKSILLDFIKKDKCDICGYNESNQSLHFHHRNPNDKNFTVSRYLKSKRIITVNDIEMEVFDELNKCDLICANCHEELHFDKEKFEKYKDDIYNWEYQELQEPLDQELVMKLYNEGMKQIDIAKMFNRNKSVICGIIKRNSMPLSASGS